MARIILKKKTNLKRMAKLFNIYLLIFLKGYQELRTKLRFELEILRERGMGVEVGRKEVGGEMDQTGVWAIVPLSRREAQCQCLQIAFVFALQSRFHTLVFIISLFVIHF